MRFDTLAGFYLHFFKGTNMRGRNQPKKAATTALLLMMMNADPDKIESAETREKKLEKEDRKANDLHVKKQQAQIHPKHTQSNKQSQTPVHQPSGFRR